MLDRQCLASDDLHRCARRRAAFPCRTKPHHGDQPLAGVDDDGLSSVFRIKALVQHAFFDVEHADHFRASDRDDLSGGRCAGHFVDLADALDGLPNKI